MSRHDEETFYLVRASILPTSIRKTIEAKKLLERNEVETTQEAAKAVDLSRSAFYKYKDSVFPFHTVMNQQIMTISVNLEHQAGALSDMLQFIAERRGNVLTINQTIPLQGLANVVLSIETAQMEINATQFTRGLQKLEPVQKVTIIGYTENE